MRRAMIVVMLLGSLAMVGGCHAPAQADNPFIIDRREYARVYRASVDVLRDAGYRIERQDYRFGHVTTAPKGSPTVFEPWYRDNTTMYQAVQSTLSSVRRRVEISIQPKESAKFKVQSPKSKASSPASVRLKPTYASETSLGGVGGGIPKSSDVGHSTLDVGPASVYSLSVKVFLEELEAPVLQLTDANGGYVFSVLTAVPQRYAQRGIEAYYWQPVGRDQALEQRLLKRIIRRSMNE